MDFGGLFSEIDQVFSRFVSFFFCFSMIFYFSSPPFLFCSGEISPPTVCRYKPRLYSECGIGEVGEWRLLVGRRKFDKQN